MASETREILGVTKEVGLFIIGFIIALIAIPFIGTTVTSMVIWDIIAITGLIIAIYALKSDFKKKKLRGMHIIGNIMMILLIALYVLFLLAINFIIIRDAYFPAFLRDASLADRFLIR